MNKWDRHPFKGDNSHLTLDLPLKDKVKLIKKAKQHGITQASLAKEFGVSTSQVSRLMKAKEDILKEFEADKSHRKHN